jgi:undecaprenyl phosphate-alpha-L-ara4N flippase subunit ArnE
MEYFFLLLSCIFTTLGQFMQKLGADKINRLPQNSPLSDKVLMPEIIMGILFLGSGAMCWLLVLSTMEVSKAYPLLSFNFILMLLLARYYFKENIPVQRWLGVLFVMAGISLISQS